MLYELEVGIAKSQTPRKRRAHGYFDRRVRAGRKGYSDDLWSFYHIAVDSAFKWLNRRGGKRKSFTWAAFNRALKRLGIARPRITEQRFLQREMVSA